MNWTEDEEFLRDLREEYRQDAMDDRRYANRSAEEILEDIHEDFADRYSELFEKAYNDLCGNLRDYGLDYSTDDIFAEVLSDACGFRHPAVADLKINQKLLTDCSLKINKQEATLNEYANVIYRQVKIIEGFSEPKSCATCSHRYFERDDELIKDTYCHLNELPISDDFGCNRYVRKAKDD